MTTLHDYDQLNIQLPADLLHLNAQELAEAAANPSVQPNQGAPEYEAATSDSPLEKFDNFVPHKSDIPEEDADIFDTARKQELVTYLAAACTAVTAGPTAVVFGYTSIDNDSTVARLMALGAVGAVAGRVGFTALKRIFSSEQAEVPESADESQPVQPITLPDILKQSFRDPELIMPDMDEVHQSSRSSRRQSRQMPTFDFSGLKIQPQ